MKKIILITTGIVFFSCSTDELTSDQNLIDEIESLTNTENITLEKENASTNKDTDNDGINDQADADIDGDGTLDNGTDSDGDGINDTADVDNNNDGIDDNGTDIDEDGINDEYDDDIDGDGISNEEDEYQNLSDTALSASVQQKITAYITSNYPDKTITEVEIDPQTIEIELSGSIELTFDLEGVFLNSEQEGDHDGSEDAENEDEDEDELDQEDDDQHEEENEYTSLSSSNLSEAVQQKILDYINANYPDLSIVEVEIENEVIEVELTNDVELIFDLNGNFLRLDD